MPWMCGKRYKYVAKDLKILNMPWMCRNGFTMLKMIDEFDKRLICMRNDVCMFEIA